ncbi:MAG: hypothetical protein U9R79_13095 [Armatimonadota bacterium]|nr:hypothetical protein [Armatimonadota bacterium]
MAAVLGILALLFASGTAFGAHGYAKTAFGERPERPLGVFVKIPGVPGTADAPGHRDFVKCVSFRLVPDDGGGQSQFTIMKRLDKASPKLARAEGEYTVYADVGWMTGGNLFGFLLKDAQIQAVQQANPSSYPHLIPDPEADVKYEMVRFICDRVKWGAGDRKPTAPIAGLLMRSGGREVPLQAVSMSSRGSGGYVPTGLLFAPQDMPRGLLSEDHNAPDLVILARGNGQENVILSMEGGTVADVTSFNAKALGVSPAAGLVLLAVIHPGSASVGD